jgi:hypothetical protein
MSRTEERAKLASQWDDRLVRYRASGQTVAAFCMAEGVSAAAFHYQARKRRESQAAPSLFRQVQVTSGLPVAAGITVRLPGGVELSLARDLELTRAVLDQLLARLPSTSGGRAC